MSAEFTNAESSDAVPSPGQSASYAGDVAPEDAYAALDDNRHAAINRANALPLLPRLAGLAR